MKKKNVHVVPSDNNWAVRTEGAQRAAKITSTQQEAIEIARKMAKANKSELLVHGENGKIRQKNSYGPDNFPPKG